MSLVRIVKLTFRDEEISTFTRLFNERKQQIRNFPGCLHLQLLQDRLHPAVFFTYSMWNDAAALEAYRHSPLFEETWRHTKLLFAAKPEAWSVNSVEVLP